MANSEYLLKFKEVGGKEVAQISSRNLDSACARINEYLEYGYELIEAHRWSLLSPSKNCIQELIAEVNRREENPDWQECEEEIARRIMADRRSAYYSQVM